MVALAQKFDTGLKGLLTAICATLLILMVFFTVWTVVMRYIFLDAPFWSDTLTMFFNVWTVFLALAITVRDRTHISMTMLYEILPPIVGFSCEFLWTVLICLFGIFIAIWGFDASWNVPGLYWEFGYMSKKWPMMIMPTVGVLMFVMASIVIFEDIVRIKKGDLTVHAHEIEDIKEYQRMAQVEDDEVEVVERADAH